MKRPEEVKWEFVHDWLAKAEGDLKACRHLLSGGSDYSEGVAFHAQQAVEKYFKAFLVWHQVEFPKTHDIGRLIELVRSYDGDLAGLLSEASHLTPYGVEYRYPGDYPDVSLSEAEHCLDTARDVRERVLERLPSDILG